LKEVKMEAILLDTEMDGNSPVILRWGGNIVDTEDSGYAYDSEDDGGQLSYSKEDFIEALAKVSQKVKK